MVAALRFDMRAPDFGASAADLYPAAVDQAAWADRLGFTTIYLAEHHGADDGYCPSPLTLAAAIAGRTQTIEIHISALVVTLHDPIRLAEDLAVLDLISGGRIAVTLGLGYRPHEFTMFGIPETGRVPRLRQALEVFEHAWTGEPFAYRDTTVTVRPRPGSERGPKVYLGGSTEKSALRAARLGYEFRPAVPALYEVYEAEREQLGLDIPPRGPRGMPTFLFVTEHPDDDWPLVAPHLIYNASTYRAWAVERGGGSTKWQPVESVEDLKASDQYQVLTPEECVAFVRQLPPDTELRFNPLMGGLQPDLAWRSLELFEQQVFPILESEGLLRGRTAATAAR